ncbi:MAG: zinc ribbon domain-containing protein [Proteobacteria bacterium]|jgi:hypothetical protein|nr:zinc ribbon domain-containing protein [Pseudomonadota bacterium]
MRCLPALLIALVVAVAAPCASGSADKYAGQWKRVSASTSVKIGSWGENCGPEPKSYSNSSVVEVEIVAQGNHLVFTKGGLRTDRCSSANPRLITKSEKITGARWERVCETAPDDSKYERDEYFYVAINDNRIEYKVKSDYDWTLKGDHCVLSLEERRVFERSGTSLKGEPVGAKEPETPAPSPEPEVAGEAPPACERQGEIMRIQVFPRDAEIGPGERICFKASGFDASGCRFDAAAVWLAQQNGVEVGGLMSRGGCFQAGATAAESEGGYEVIAMAEGKKASASVRVVFPDLSDLLHVRLDPARELGAPAAAGSEAGGASGPAATNSTPAPIAAPEPAGAPLLLILAVCLVIVVAAGVVIIVIVFRKRTAARVDEDDEDADGGAWPKAPKQDPSKVSCPKCGEMLPAGSRFCPLDGTAIASPGSSPSVPPPDAPGMVCPKCHRGYGSDARFCPHDSARLVPYPEWRSGRRSGR